MHVSIWKRIASLSIDIFSMFLRKPINRGLIKKLQLETQKEERQSLPDEKEFRSDELYWFYQQKWEDKNKLKKLHTSEGTPNTDCFFFWQNIWEVVKFMKEMRRTYFPELNLFCLIDIL